MLAISRAPGWQRLRIVGGLAFTAGLYSLFDLLGVLYPREFVAYAWVTSANLSVAAVHVVIWLWFSYSDAQGRWRSMPRWIQWAGLAHVAWTVTLSLTGNAIDPTHVDIVEVRWLGVRFGQPALTTPGMVSAAVSIALLGVSFVEQVRQARRGVPGARLIATGFAIFVGCGIEEVLVAAGVLDFIFLAEVGYLGIVIPVIAQFVRRFIDDAHRLQELTEALGAKVQVTTEERDAARAALAVQERFAALGRIAAGVAHEINNPLQVLTLHLEELRGSLRRSHTAEVDEALEQSLEATERIHRIVAGLGAYARPVLTPVAELAPSAIVEEALREAAPHLQSLGEVRRTFVDAPTVLGDRERLVRAVVNLLVNAATAARTPRTGVSRVEVRVRPSPTGDAVIEVCDNGPGLPRELLQRIGEPFVSTRVLEGGAGLGLFVVRGVVDAHGGVLEFENARDGGAEVRIVLPAAVRR